MSEKSPEPRPFELGKEETKVAREEERQREKREGKGRKKRREKEKSEGRAKGTTNQWFLQ